MDATLHVCTVYVRACIRVSVHVCMYDVYNTMHEFMYVCKTMYVCTCVCMDISEYVYVYLSIITLVGKYVCQYVYNNNYGYQY